MLHIQSNTRFLHGIASSQQGGRPENQDNLAYTETPLGFVVIVCDGMGGGPGGKTASTIAIRTLIQTLQDCTATMEPEKAIRMGVSHAHEALMNEMIEKPSLKGMGTTLVMLLINNQKAYIAHAGDSRCYHLRKSRSIFVTKDHSLVMELVKAKAMTREQARLSPQSNVITRGLGSLKNQTIDIHTTTYHAGDRFVLCTDGVWGAMLEKTLIRRLTAKDSLEVLASNLAADIDRIGYNEGGHHDNHTLVIIDMEHTAQGAPRIYRPDLSPYSWLLLTAGAISFVTFLIILIANIASQHFSYNKDQAVPPPNDIPKKGLQTEIKTRNEQDITLPSTSIGEMKENSEGSLSLHDEKSVSSKENDAASPPEEDTPENVQPAPPASAPKNELKAELNENIRSPEDSLHHWVQTAILAVNKAYHFKKRVRKDKEKSVRKAADYMTKRKQEVMAALDSIIKNAEGDIRNRAIYLHKVADQAGTWHVNDQKEEGCIVANNKKALEQLDEGLHTLANDIRK